MSTKNKMNKVSEPAKKAKSKQSQLRDLALRLATLPEAKRNEFRQALDSRGIDPWKLPLVARNKKNSEGDTLSLESSSFTPLSFAQQRLWFIEQTEPGNPLYNLLFGLRFDGNLEKHLVEQSLNTIIYRHSILRTIYTATDDGEGRQQINAFQGINVDTISAVEQEIADIAHREAITPFDLTKDLMFRFKLVEINENEVFGFFTIHHIAFDALSVDLLIQEFISLYCYFCEQKLSPQAIARTPLAIKDLVDSLPELIGLPELPIEYADFADWQQQWAQSQQFEAQKKYWQQQLSGAPQRIDLPTDFSRPKNRRCTGKKIDLSLSVALSDKIRALAQKQNVTLYMLLMATFNLLLSRYSQQDDICVGTSIANRTKEETHPLLGFFVNLLVMRNHVKSQSTFIEFLHSVNDTATAAYQHQDFPFEKLLEVLEVERDNSSTPLFQVLFVLNTATQSQALELPGVKVSAFNDDQEIARYDLTLRVSDNGNGNAIFCQLEYDTDLFLATTAHNILEYYQQLMLQVTTHPERNLRDFSLLSQLQQYRLLQEQIGASSISQPDACISIHQMFEVAAREHDDASALICENDVLNYQQLNEQANRLAHYLRQHLCHQGVPQETPVALFMERSTSLIVGLLAVLKAGGVYIPLDVQWPQKRLQTILDDSNARLILTENEWQETLAPFSGEESATLKRQILFLDNEQDQCLWSQCSTNNLDGINTETATDAAYIIYTSGSTGEPKGVVIEHRQLVNYIVGITHRLSEQVVATDDDADNCNNACNYSFASVSTVAADLGNTAVYGALCFGGCLHLINNERSFDPDAVAEYMDQHKVDVLKIVPSHLQGLLAANKPERLLPKKVLILGGEACLPSLVRDVRALSPELRIINHYGPTEATVGVLSYEIPFNFDDVSEHKSLTSIPIGRPLANSQAYVLDDGYNICPQGVAGELFIAGQGLARGYLRRPQLTGERFIERQLHSNIAPQRLYRTGDKVRYLHNGDIEFLGRIDEQIKVRGYRVELGDIRSSICSLSNVHDAAVIIDDGGVSQRLIAYVVENEQQKSEDKQGDKQEHKQSARKDRLLNALTQQLPEYMMPQQIVLIAALPLTVNGKLDRHTLLALAKDDGDDNHQVAAPRDKLEQQLVNIWCEVLHNGNLRNDHLRNHHIGVDDNFFALGGDSILSLQVIAKAKKLGISFTPKQLFDEKCISRLARVAKTAQSDVEKTLLSIWANILKHENIDRHDNFFSLGGDSILSLQVVAQARKAGLKLTPKQLFDSPTVAQLAGLVKNLGTITSSDKESNKENYEGSLPLTPIQHWFFSADHPNNHHWNQSSIFTVKQSLNFDFLQKSILALVQHHDALRMRFSRGNDGVKNSVLQEYSPASKDLEESVCQYLTAQDLGVDKLAENNTLSNESISDLIDDTATKIQQSLDLENGPLLRVVYFNIDNFDYTKYGVSKQHNRLLFVIHHLVVDGVSWRILLNDLYECYQKLAQGKMLDIGESSTNCLNKKSSSYKKWAQSLHHYASSSALAKEINYWQQAAHDHGEEKSSYIRRFGVKPTLSETEIVRLNTVATQRVVTQSLNAEETMALLHKVPSTYRTQINDLLLTAFSQVLCSVSNTDAVQIELEGHGRESLFNDDYIGDAPEPIDELDLSQTIGWFTSRFPVRLYPLNKGGKKDTSHSIKAIKEQLRKIPNKGFGYGVLRYLHPDAVLRENFQAHTVPVLSFNYLGQLDSTINEDTKNKTEINNHQSPQVSLFDLFGATQETGGIERSPQSRRTHILDLTVQVSGGCLQLKWYFSEALHNRRWVEKLAADYNKALQELINHCVEEKTGGVTPSDFPLVELPQPLLDQMPVEWNNIETLYPLSPMQEGLLFHTLMNPGTGIYFMQERYQVNSALDHKAFTQAWAAVVERHEVLRTSFYWQNEDQLLQLVHKHVVTPVTILDWRHLDEPQQRQKMQTWMEDELTTGFDLATPTQIAITLVQVGDEKYQLVRSFHHILMDAWCFSLLMMDFLAFYQAIVEERDKYEKQEKNEKRKITRPRLRPYRDYIAWLQRQDIDNAEIYWRDYLSGFSAPTSLIVDQPQNDSGVADVSTMLTLEQTKQLHQLAKDCQITVNTIVQGAWALLLSRYSGDTDVVFGVTVAGRPTELEDAHSVIGLFINSLPLRVNIDDTFSVRTWLQALFTRNVSMREYEFAPLVDIQSWSDLPRGEDLFKSLFVFENAPIDAEMMDKSVAFQIDERTDRTHTNYPITVVIGPSETLSLQLTYDKRYFDEPTVQSMLGHFKQLLVSMISDTEQSIANVEMLLPEEKNTILQHWSGAAETLTMDQLIDHHRGKLWPQRFAEQVTKVPHRVAAVCGDTQLTYSELNEHANRVAHGLIEKGIGCNSLVALLGERDLDLLIMIIGVLKAGAAYLPLDPSHPPQRMAKIIELSKAKLVLSSENTAALLDKSTNLVAQQNTVIFTTLEVLSTKQADQNPDIISHYNDLAYVIYTSGSTGVPKGAMVEHLGMLNNMLGKLPSLGVNENDVIAQTASQCFDISVWQFLTALIVGARVEIYPNAIAQDPTKLFDSVVKNGVTILESVPSMIRSMLDVCNGSELCLPLRWILPTGEVLPPELARDWLLRFPNIPLMNAYGPAECADDVAFWPLHDVSATDVAHMPIGRATENNQLYVLDRLQRPVPAGVPGELYIAGAGVGRGYINDAKRTDDVFLKHPFIDVVNKSQQAQRFYRSGDLVCFRPDGVLEYRGRLDYQVKVRGYRIELGEIESRLFEHEDIRQVAVLTKKDPRGDSGDNSIVAYIEACVAGESRDQQNTNHWRQFIKETLPEYMVPSVFVVLPKMPLNRNGKIDRQNLPDPEFSQLSATSYVAPRNVHERGLVDIWKKVLKLERVGIDDNFFELGGHSLLAIKMVHQMQHRLSQHLSLAALFQSPTIRQLVALVEGEVQSQVRRIRPANSTSTTDPLFCIHHGGGHTLEYQSIAAGLDATIPVYAIQSRRLFEPNYKESSLKSIALEYAQMITDIQAIGPYRLLGWSLGGILAMEITSVLEKQGHTVSFVGLIDAVHNVEINPELFYTDNNDKHSVVNSKTKDNNVIDNMLLMFGEEGRRQYETIDPNLRKSLEQQLQTLDTEAALQYVIDWASEQSLLDETVDQAFLTLRYRTSVHYRELMHAHHPSYVKAAPHIWWAGDSLRDGHPPTAWHLCCDQLGSTQSYAGSHYDIMELPALHQAISLQLREN